MLNISAQKILPPGSIWYTFIGYYYDAYYENKKISQVERGKCVSSLVLQVICFVATLRQLAKFLSAPIFSPLKGNFCDLPAP